MLERSDLIGGMPSVCPRYALGMPYVCPRRYALGMPYVGPMYAEMMVPIQLTDRPHISLPRVREPARQSASSSLAAARHAKGLITCNPSE